MLVATVMYLREIRNNFHSARRVRKQPLQLGRAVLAACPSAGLGRVEAAWDSRY